MSGQGIAQILFYAVVLVALALSARDLDGADLRRAARRRPPLRRCVDRARLLPRRPHRPEARAGLEGLRHTVLVFSVLFWRVLYAIQRLQGHLFLNPDHLKGVPAHLSLNTAASFITNTNWQFYGGEYTMSYLTQMAGSRGAELRLRGGRDGGARRGRPRHRAPHVGHARELLGRPLPLARLHPAAARGGRRRDPRSGRACRRRSAGTRPRRRCRARTQSIARGPVASQIAIKQLGHERRRLLQLELGRAVREPDRALELRRDARRSC